MAKILAIDDQEQILELITAFLENDEHEVLTATKGSDAIKKAHQFKPDLIVCDVNMPDMTGFEVIKYIREDATLSKVPFVFLTGLDDMKTLREGMNLGADDYLTKPFSYAELSETVKVRIEKYRQLSENYEAELRAAELRAEEALMTDEVTGLPNRKRLNQYFQNKVLEMGSVAVMSIGFDDFQNLSMQKPEAFINVLLKGASTRLREILPGEDKVFYVDRNQFVILLPNDEQLPRITQGLLGELSEPFRIMRQEHHLKVSIGIARCPDDGDVLAILLRKTLVARSKAEAAGGNQYSFAE